MRAVSMVLACLITIGSVVASAQARPGILWNESVNGDLSNDRLNPTPVTLDPGINSLFATSVSGDREYVTITVPAPLQVSAIMLVSYVGNDPLGFIGVQAGSTFTEPPTGTVVGNLLGWSHFGTGNGTIGTDILDNMGVGAGAMGFTPPLASGQYTFWIQQTGVNAVTYQLDFIATPGAPSAALLAVGGLFGCGRRRRRMDS